MAATSVLNTLLLSWVTFVFPCHLPSGLLRSKDGHRMFNMHSDRRAICAHEGQKGSDESAQVSMWKNLEMVLHPVVSRSWTSDTGFTDQRFSQPAMNYHQAARFEVGYPFHVAVYIKSCVFQLCRFLCFSTPDVKTSCSGFIWCEDFFFQASNFHRKELSISTFNLHKRVFVMFCIPG